MKRILLLVITCIALCSHDMYLKLDTYFLKPGARATIKLFNGTFDRSDNVISRDRMLDVSLVGNGQRSAVDTSLWTERDGVTLLHFTTGDPGTWVAGVSTRPRNIEMEAQKFNDYLEHDGVTDMLTWRKENNALDKDAVEKYSKHVKTIFQVGDQLTDDWQTVLGYPIEFVPLDNPYDMHPGHTMQVKLLMDGKPLTDQLVYVACAHASASSTGQEAAHTHSDHSHEHDDHTHTHSAAGHTHDSEDPSHASDGHTHEHSQYRTDAKGQFSFDVTHAGIWYIRTIHLVESEEEGLTHESNWATLTFEVGDGSIGHSHAHDHDHTHEGEHGSGVPGYVYWLASLLIVGILFVIFNRSAK